MSNEPAPSKVDEQKVIADEAAPATKTEKNQQKAAEDYSKKEENGELSMKVKVYSPFRDYYDGQAFSLSAENTTGPFDVLPKHHNFISLLMPCELVVRSVKDGDRKIKISGGIVHVKSDKATVFLDV